MPRKKLAVEVNRFSKGIIGTASAVDFPADAATVLDNVILNKDGSVSKRNGLTTRLSFTVEEATALTTTNGVYRQFLGKLNVVRDGEQVPTLWFGVQGDNPDVGVRQDIAVFALDPSTDTYTRVQMLWEDGSARTIYAPHGSSPVIGVGGYNVITTFGQNFASYVDAWRWDGVTESLRSGNTLSLKVRDSWGMYVDNDDDDTTDPTTGPLQAKYNALNQGYSSSATIKVSSSGAAVIPARIHAPALTFDSGTTYYTSKQSNSILPIAPKGRRIQDFANFTRGGGGTGTISTYTLEGDKLTQTWPRAVSYGGRAFYWYEKATQYDYYDRNRPAPTHHILFSQVVESDSNLNRAYSKNDPTAGMDSDTTVYKWAQPLETDGGVIIIDGSGDILELVELGNSLIVFAENGIWEISGPFSPISYSIRKLSEDTLVDRRTVIKLESSIVFGGWNEILSIQPDVRSGRLYVDTVSAANLGDLYKEEYRISPEYPFAFVGHDKQRNTVEWTWCESFSTAGLTNKFRSLVYDRDLGAFYTKTFQLPPNGYIGGLVQDPTDEYGDLCYVVYTWSNTLHEVDIRIMGTNDADAPRDIFYTYSGLYNDNELHEYNASPVVPYMHGVVETGDITFGDASKYKQAPVIYTYLQQVIDDYDAQSSRIKYCSLQYKMNFSSSDSTGKWSTPREVYRLNRFEYPTTETFDYGYNTIVTKNKVRGRGRAIKIRYELGLASCRLYGWHFSLLVNEE